MDYYYSTEIEVEELVGLTFVSVDGGVGDDELRFLGSDGFEYVMCHDQSCCESVTVEDICGDLQDLVGAEIVKARENESHENPQGVSIEYQDSFTWTFYDLATIKGAVTIRWYGESNGYYSESVEIRKSNIPYK